MSRAPMVSLGDLMAERLGSVDPAKFADETFELYSIPAFDSRRPEVLTGGEIGSTKQLVGPRDVLLSKIVPHIRRSWIVGAAGEYRQIASGEWIVFRSEKVVPEYLRHALLCDNFHTQFMQTVSGVGGSLLRARPAQVAKIEIRLPPIAEQRRIAAILDKADALRTERRKALAELDRLAHAIFMEMFGDPMTNAKGWPMVSVGEVADVQGGLQVTSARKNLPVEVPYLRVANVYRGRLQLAEVKTIRATANEVARTKLVPHDMLVVEGHGNPEEVGRGALWGGEIEECVHQNHLIRLRFDLSKVAPAFACEYMNSPGGRQHLLRAGKTTSGLNTISVSNVRAVPIALPPLVAQKAFEQRLREVGRLKAVHQPALEMTNSLFTSLQHSAFRGELE